MHSFSGRRARRSDEEVRQLCSLRSSAALVDIKTKWKSEDGQNRLMNASNMRFQLCHTVAAAVATHIYIHIHTDIHINESVGEIIQLLLTSASFGQCRRQWNVYECGAKCDTSEREKCNQNGSRGRKRRKRTESTWRTRKRNSCRMS